MWFPDDECSGIEEFGLKLPSRFPLEGKRIVLCEAEKEGISPSLIGQALVYRLFARRAGAAVERTVIFANSASKEMREAALELGLEVVVTR